MEAKLIVIEGTANRREIAIKLPVTIGRSRAVNLTVAHPMVSRQHCELLDIDGVVVIRDLASLNGTFVHGERIGETALRPDGVFSVGPLTFQIEYDYQGNVEDIAVASESKDKTEVSKVDDEKAESEPNSQSLDEEEKEEGVDESDFVVDEPLTTDRDDNGATDRESSDAEAMSDFTNWQDGDSGWADPDAVAKLQAMSASQNVPPQEESTIEENVLDEKPIAKGQSTEEEEETLLFEKNDESPSETERDEEAAKTSKKKGWWPFGKDDKGESQERDKAEELSEPEVKASGEESPQTSDDSTVDSPVDAISGPKVDELPDFLQDDDSDGDDGNLNDFLKGLK